MTGQVNPVARNQMQRDAVIGMGQLMTQPLPVATVTPADGPITIQPRNVGLVCGFIVKVYGDVENGAATQANRTGFGSANILSNITFTDLNNVQRINTTGRHMAMLNSAKQGFGYGGAYAPNLPMAWGNNWTPFEGPVSLAADASGTVAHTYWVPLAYDATDLRGSIFANVVSANMQLQFTVNPTPFVGATDPLNAIYSGNAGGAWDGDVTIEVYQVYYDQLPQIGGQFVVPELDINTIYDIKKTVTPVGLAANQEYPIAYSNFRAFLSTFLTYDNGGVFNAGANPDIQRFKLRAANSTNLWDITPDVAALQARQTFMADPPPGTYYFDHRRKPIDTLTYGNMELVVLPSVVNANAFFEVSYEAFQQINNTAIASSLPGGAN